MSLRFVVPPHLLRAIAASDHNPNRIRETARATLRGCEHLVAARKVSKDRKISGTGKGIIPDHMLEALAKHGNEKERNSALRTLKVTKDVERRAGGAHHSERAIYDAENSMSLPGKLVRDEGDPEVKDDAVNSAFDNTGSALKFYKKFFKWDSIDNKKMDVISSVHYGREFENAYWDPEKRQMVFGDGGEFLNNFVGCTDMIGHELTHAVTEHIAALDYYGQPGALSEHISDVFGIMIKQWVQDEKAVDADWLIGEECILPGVKGVALRSMKSPGKAYNDPRFGKDPQVDHMSDFHVMFEDNGGVHIFSGIPNKAFYLAAVSFGGYSWEKAGQIWWKALFTGSMATFEQFAKATVDVAAKENQEAAEVVREAWSQVGVDTENQGGGRDGSCQVS